MKKFNLAQRACLVVVVCGFIVLFRLVCMPAELLPEYRKTVVLTILGILLFLAFAELLGMLSKEFDDFDDAA